MVVRRGGDVTCWSGHMIEKVRVLVLWDSVPGFCILEARLCNNVALYSKLLMASCSLNNNRLLFLLLHAWSSTGRSRIHGLHVGRTSRAHIQSTRLLPSSTIHDCGLLDRLSRNTVTHFRELLLRLSAGECPIQMSLLSFDSHQTRWHVGIV